MQQSSVYSNPAGEPMMTAASQSILRTLAYFDIFHYPLTTAEIKTFSDQYINDWDIADALNVLVAGEMVFCHYDHYSLQDNPLLVLRRRQGNQQAALLLKKADRIGNFLFRFPFVRGVAISGSLSKNFADEYADIDFFIITAPNRLWVARTLMHLYKKLAFLRGRQHLYCMNYYVDETSLLLQDQNIFTAIELKTLLPVAGQETFDTFYTVNAWADGLLPVCRYRTTPHSKHQHPLLKTITERLLGLRLFAGIDTFLWHITRSRWNKKYEKGKKNGKGITMDLVTGKHFARSNPGNFQEKIIEQYEKKIAVLQVAAQSHYAAISSAE